MWFRELCTIDEWGDLTRENRSNRSWCNAWMEGFEESNEKLFYMAQSLRKTNMAAIYRPSNPDALSWLAYHPSSEFRRLTWSPEMSKLPDGVPICLAVRGPLSDISTGNMRNTIENSNRELGNDTSRLDTSAIHPSRRWQVEPSVKADARVPDEIIHGEGVGTDPLTDNEGPEVLNSPPEVQEAVVASENTRALGIAQMLQFFKLTIKMTVKDLGTLPNGGIADMFYLHFPLEDEEACVELRFMELWLSAHQVKCWTSRDPRNWEKFHSNCKRGVIIFHESFFRYETLRPKIRSFQWKPHFNFWSIRLQRPLDQPDLQHCHEGSHIQSLFPSSTAMLLTEDVLRDMKRAAMIICWFYHRRLLAGPEGSKPSKLVLWPNVLTQLDKKLDDPHRNKDDDPCILSIIACIRSANSIDPNHPEFEPSILSIQDIDCPNNNVICLPVPGYGHRTGTEHPDIPKGLTQEERNADHLVEAFAGWTHLHAARFRKTAVVTFLKKDTLLSHWSDWGHVAVLDFRDFCRAYSTDEAVLFDRLQNGPPQADHSPNTPRDPPTPRESQDPRVSRRDNAPANPSLSRVFDTQTGRVEPYQ
ncbi:hypothetical protein N7454_008265 [Penicillium verhagenii]|nr:hypothetical protein N7454_008265 [Penicillium verhagenii]